MLNFDELFAALPAAIEPEFVMSTLNGPIELVLGPMEVFRNGQRLAILDGRVAVEWTPRLRIECSGDSDEDLHSAFADDQPVELRVAQIGLRAEALVTALSYGARQHVRLLITSTDNPSLRPSASCRFYLVNFCDFIGEAVRYGGPPTVVVGRNRLSFSSGDLRCTVDCIRASNGLISTDGATGYALTHVGSLSTISGTTLAPDEMRDALDALYWFFTFMRGARSGPILPSTDVPFAANWISLSPWKIDEARNVHSWVPDRAPIELSPLFDRFLQRWSDPDWNEAIRTTLAWYVTANSPGIPNEARIPLSQISLEVLASLHAAPGAAAFQRLRALLSRLSIPLQVPPRLSALAAFAQAQQTDAAETLTRIRNKLEHPTAANRLKLGAVSGVVRMQAAEYGLELFELSMLATLGYQGKHVRRAFQGWKGDDAAFVPWATVVTP